MATKKHTHKFRRHRYNTGNEIYFCALPDCSVKIKPALTLGKRSLCWRCGNEFIMNDYSVRLAKPHCEDCHKSKLEPETFVPEPNTPPPSIVHITDLRERFNRLTTTATADDEDI